MATWRRSGLSSMRVRVIQSPIPGASWRSSGDALPGAAAGGGGGVVRGGAGEIEQRFHGRRQHMPGAAADAFGGVGEVEQGSHGGGELLAAATAERIGVGLQVKARASRSQM